VSAADVLRVSPLHGGSLDYRVVAPSLSDAMEAVRLVLPLGRSILGGRPILSPGEFAVFTVPTRDVTRRYAYSVRAFDRIKVGHVWAAGELEAREKALKEVHFTCSITTQPKGES
jgi:hypothetical protein